MYEGKMERLTFDGLFCDISMCTNTPGGSLCESGSCSQRKVWERLKAYEDIGAAEEFAALREQLIDVNAALNLTADACKTIEANYKSQLLGLREQLARKSKLVSQQARELNRRDDIIRRQDDDLSRVTAERDAAVEHTKRLCYLEYKGWCENDGGPCDGCASEWRGPQKER